MKLAAFIGLCLAIWWTYMILMVLLTAYYRQWRRRRSGRKRRIPAGLPRCLLVRPCAGEETGLLDCLTSIARTRRDFPVRVVFGVDSEDDPALKVAHRAASLLAEEGIECSVEVTPVIGPNRKVSILAGCVAAAGADWDIVLSADSNTDLTGFDLNRFVATLARDDGVAAVWAPPRVEAPSRGLGNLASEAVLHGSWHSFGILSLIDPAGMMGKLFGVTRRALFEIGGFDAMVGFLGEDMEMSRRLRAAGFKVESFSVSVKTVSGATTWAETLARHARWMMVIKAQRRLLMLSYPLLFFNALIVYGLALFGFFYSVTAGAICVSGAFLLRLLVGYSAARMLGVRLRPTEVVSHAFVADILLLFAFVRALRMRTVEWRGKVLSFGPNGELNTPAGD
jgi:ceramide glucosyltransferase